MRNFILSALKRIPVLIGITAAMIVLIGCFVTVPPGHVGVKHRLGAVRMNHLPEGFHFKLPFIEKVEKIDVRLRAADKQSGASSKDLQVVSTRVTVQYSLTGPVTPLTYQKIGNREIVEVALIDPAIQESVKAVTAQYTAEELVTKRAAVKALIRDVISSFIEQTLQEKGVVGAMSIANVAITDFQFSSEFNRAIEEKVKAEQDALKAKNEKLRIITQAEAAAAKVKLEAEALAYQIEVESISRADAIRREAEALRDNPQLIELRIAEKWDGKLPYVNGAGALPLINVDNVGRGRSAD